VTCPPWSRERHAALVTSLYTSRWSVSTEDLARDLRVVTETIRRWARRHGLGQIIGWKRMFTEAEAELLRALKNPYPKLTDVDVLRIRDLRRCGVLQREIADAFDTTQENVSRITAGRRWAHIGEGN